MSAPQHHPPQPPSPNGSAAPSRPHPTTTANNGMQTSRVTPNQLIDHIAATVLGKRPVIELAVLTLLGGGHLLLDDVPGLGKTLLARTIADAIGAPQRRLQGASDVLPSDVTGSSVWRPDSGTFSFVPGPVFANVMLVDELNRMPPRTQAALLEAMEEQQVSVDGKTYRLPDPHIVIATQNPLGHAGTFPLIEAQRDRFMASTTMGYPSETIEANIITSSLSRSDMPRSASPKPSLLTLDDVIGLRHQVSRVVVSPDLVDYVVRLVSQTRRMPAVRLGASPRAGVQLTQIARARAYTHGRDHVLPDDVKAVAVAVLSHRLVVDRSDLRPADLVNELLGATPVVRP